MNILIRILLILIAAPIVGCLLSGIDRKINARFQGRKGPSIFQPFYDFVKLMHKENIVVSKYQNVYVIIYLMFVIASIIMFFFNMDLLMIIFVFTIANIAFIVGAMSTGSPYAKLGAQREIMAMLSYEPILIFFIVGIYMLTGTFKISRLLQASSPMILYTPLIFIAMIYIMCIKFKKSPFDLSTSHHGHQELVKGLTTEISGPAMGIIELTHWYEATFLMALMSLFCSKNIILGILIALITYFIAIIVDNIWARLTWEWMVKTTWGVVVVISIVNILGIYFLNCKLV